MNDRSPEAPKPSSPAHESLDERPTMRKMWSYVVAHVTAAHVTTAHVTTAHVIAAHCSSDVTAHVTAHVITAHVTAAHASLLFTSLLLTAHRTSLLLTAHRTSLGRSGDSLSERHVEGYICNAYAYAYVYTYAYDRHIKGTVRRGTSKALASWGQSWRAHAELC